MGEWMPIGWADTVAGRSYRIIIVSAQSPVFFPDFIPDLKTLELRAKPTSDKVIEF